jgi:hypothetical protein
MSSPLPWLTEDTLPAQYAGTAHLSIAIVSDKIEYHINQYDDDLFHAVKVMKHKRGGSSNLSLKETKTEEEARAAAQADWDASSTS